MAEIGIIMPIFYESSVVRKGLEMLAQQTRKDAIEVILINDCSPNTQCDYQDLLDEFSSQLNIKYLKTKTNSGPGVARQLGMDYCSTPWIMFHDDDDMLNNPYVIEKYLETIKNYNSDISCLIAIDCDHIQINGYDEIKRHRSTVCGNIYNATLLKKHQINFKANISFYEEDRLFATKLFYYSQAYKYKILRMENIDSNFISYTKDNTNRVSICSTIGKEKESRYQRVLQAYHCFFDFYLSLPVDETSARYLRRRLNDSLNYINSYCIKFAQEYKLSDEIKQSFLCLYKKFKKLKTLYPEAEISSEYLSTYENFIKTINHCKKEKVQRVENCQPQIGIILPCYYSSEVIRPALEILAQQTRKDAMEVILINDCSPNTNCEYQDLLNEFSSQLNIKYLKTEKNGGPSAARQLGINNCSCPWVLFHDDDDTLYDAHVIETYLDIIEKAKNKNILSAIYTTRLHCRKGAESETIQSGGLIGNLYNLNLIKLFNVTFDMNLSYEEDNQFLVKYFYHCERLKKYFPELNVQIEFFYRYQPEFISYTKYTNSNSICSNLSLVNKTIKALSYIESLFDFYLSQPKDDILEKILKKQQLHLKYLITFCINRAKSLNIINDLKWDFIKVHNKFEELLKYYPDVIEIEQLQLYYKSIKDILGDN